jgi:NAD-dependent DNA ligase
VRRRRADAPSKGTSAPHTEPAQLRQTLSMYSTIQKAPEICRHAELVVGILGCLAYYAHVDRKRPELPFDIVYQENDVDGQGRLGRLRTFESVFIGVSVSSATLQNMDEFQRKGVRIGDRVIVNRFSQVLEIVQLVVERWPVGARKVAPLQHCAAPTSFERKVRPSRDALSVFSAPISRRNRDGSLPCNSP